MDTSEKYITMCAAAEEIQAMRTPQKDGEYAYFEQRSKEMMKSHADSRTKNCLREPNISPLTEIENMQKQKPSDQNEEVDIIDAKILNRFKEIIVMDKIKTYLADASENLKQIVPNAVFVKFTETGTVLLEGEFSSDELKHISNLQIEVVAALERMKKEA